jgi:hypothetical protein
METWSGGLRIAKSTSQPRPPAASADAPGIGIGIALRGFGEKGCTDNDLGAPGRHVLPEGLFNVVDFVEVVSYAYITVLIGAIGSFDD